MMNWLWAGMVLVSVACAAATGRMDGLFAASMTGAAGAVQLFIKLLAVYTLWSGVLEIVEDSGLAGRFARLLRRPLGWLFPSVPADSAAARFIGINIAANMLGVGNAATPAGLQAIGEMKAMARGSGATDDMCMLLIVNISSLQLLPTTVIALRQAAGSASAADIVLPSLIATACATVFGTLAGKAFASLGRKRLEQ